MAVSRPRQKRSCSSSVMPPIEGEVALRLGQCCELVVVHVDPRVVTAIVTVAGLHRATSASRLLCRCKAVEAPPGR